MTCEQFVYIAAIILFLMVLSNMSVRDSPKNENNEYYEPPQPQYREFFRIIPKDSMNECMSRCQTNKDVAELLRNGSDAGKCVMDCFYTANK